MSLQVILVADNAVDVMPRHDLESFFDDIFFDMIIGPLLKHTSLISILLIIRFPLTKRIPSGN